MDYTYVTKSAYQAICIEFFSIKGLENHLVYPFISHLKDYVWDIVMCFKLHFLPILERIGQCWQASSQNSINNIFASVGDKAEHNFLGNLHDLPVGHEIYRVQVLN
jgi:hypothetical protein